MNGWRKGRQIFYRRYQKKEKLKYENGSIQNIDDGSEKLKVLEYSDNLDGWSEDHTEMIDHKIGPNHPIDISSREFCKFLINKFLFLFL